MDKIALEV